jgi:hypothetical protein
MTATTKQTLLEAIQSATEDDLAAITQRLEFLDKERAGLIEVKKVISHRLFGKQSPVRRKAGSNGGNGSNGSGSASNSKHSGESLHHHLASSIYDLIAVEGPGTANQIAVKLTVKGLVTSSQQVGVTCGKCDWFEKDADGRWVIARKRGI